MEKTNTAFKQRAPGSVDQSTESMDGVDPFVVPDEAVRQRLGLSRAQLRKTRGPAGVRWALRGRSILWSEQGVLAAEREIMDASGATVDEVDVKKPALEVFVVARVRTRSVLHVVTDGVLYDPAHPTQVWVPKGAADLFVPKMRLLAAQRPGVPHLFDFMGNPDRPEKGRRLPRRKGRW